MVGLSAAPAVRAWAKQLSGDPGRRGSDPAGDLRVLPGFFRAVDYSSRTRYRRPPGAYRRLQRLAPRIATLGIVPKYVVTLEVPGRRSGVIRRTTLVQTSYRGEHYLVALAGEAEWVRNVRAAGGRVTLGRRQRYPATLVEVAAADRPVVIRAYLLRAGRRPGSKKVANEARHYFGVSADPTLAEIGPIVEHYPVFRIVPDGAPGASPGARSGTSAGDPAGTPADPPHTNSSPDRST